MKYKLVFFLTAALLLIAAPIFSVAANDEFDDEDVEDGTVETEDEEEIRVPKVLYLNS